MNPELQRNLWLEATPSRLLLMTGLLLLVFMASAAPSGLLGAPFTALALYWFFAVLWGTRSAASSVVVEIRERTWDGQKLSSIGPWEMVWGKLFGASAANWFGALLCLPVILWQVANDAGFLSALYYGAILLTLGIFAQAIALLASLVLIRRNSASWRLDIFLCQMAGIGAAFSYYALWRSPSAFEQRGATTIDWWDHVFDFNSFHYLSLLAFLAWALAGCWRVMRAELRFANGPYVWLAYLLYLSLYTCGFQSRYPGPFDLVAGAEIATRKLLLAQLPLFASTYAMVLLERKDPVRLRWLGERIAAGDYYQAFQSLDCWMLSYGATWIAGLAFVVAQAGHGASLVLPVLAALGFLTRDVAIFLLIGGKARGKGDFAALAILGALYLLMPRFLDGLGLEGMDYLFIPTGSGVAGPIAAWSQGAVLAALALRRRVLIS